MCLVYTNNPEDTGSVPGRVIPKTQIMVFDALLNTQHYKVQTRICGPIPEKEYCPPLHLCVVAIENRAFGLPSTMACQLTCMCVCVIPIYILKNVYLGSELWLSQVLLKTMEHSLLLLIVIFQVLLFFLCQDPGGKGFVPYILPKRFRPDFGSLLGVV